MKYTDKEYCLEVWGDMACFTRPELKVERVSYDVITPSDYCLHDKLRRVQLEIDNEGKTYDEIAAQLLRHKRVLCIVNNFLLPTFMSGAKLKLLASFIR